MKKVTKLQKLGTAGSKAPPKGQWAELCSPFTRFLAFSCQSSKTNMSKWSESLAEGVSLRACARTDFTSPAVPQWDSYFCHFPKPSSGCIYCKREGHENLGIIFQQLYLILLELETQTCLEFYLKLGIRIGVFGSKNGRREINNKKKILMEIEPLISIQRCWVGWNCPGGFYYVSFWLLVASYRKKGREVSVL